MDSPIACTTMASVMHPPKPQPQQPKPQKTFPLFNLPMELVLQILSHACTPSTKSTPLQITRKPTNPHLSAQQPAITKTCHLFRHEGLKIFYQNNTFLSSNSLYGLSDFWNFFTCIGTHSAMAIRTIMIEWVSGPWEPRRLADRSWEHFVCEMQFLIKARIPMVLQDREVYVRARGGKILLGSGEFEQCYQISLREDLDGEGWLSAKALAKEDVAWRISEGPEFWVNDVE